MRKIMMLALTLGAIAALLGLGTAFAAGHDAGKGARGGSSASSGAGTEAVVAIGSLKEADGGTVVVDMRAGQRNGSVLGNLRFFSPTDGYYNGAVQSLTVTNGVIDVSGGGVLVTAQGQPERVQYTAQLTVATKQVTINVTGKDGDRHTIAGTLDPGTVHASGSPARGGASGA